MPVVKPNTQLAFTNKVLYLGCEAQLLIHLISQIIECYYLFHGMSFQGSNDMVSECLALENNRHLF